jgi:hypothetical protein
MSAKNIKVKPIPKPAADKIIKKIHYSGKVVNNSQLNFGVFYKDILMGAMQFGPPTDKSRILPLVANTAWNGMLELNRLAFSDNLPRFSESRAISLAFKWIKKNAPHIEWIISFADGTQCGHGTIYQASNFKLSQIRKNAAMIALPDGQIVHNIMFSPSKLGSPYASQMKKHGITSKKKYLDDFYPGWFMLEGYMYRYIYFINKNAEKRYTGEYLPFSKIKELNAQMIRGEWVKKNNNESKTAEIA